MVRTKAVHLCVDCGDVCSRQAKRCRPCSRKFVGKALKGRPLSATHAARVAAAKFNKPMPNCYGPTAPHWRGGSKQYRGFGWRSAKRAALERDGYKCIVCGGTRCLCVHHVKSARETGGEWDNSLDNLQTKCGKCHLAGHRETDVNGTCPVCGKATMSSNGRGVCSSECKQESNRRALKKYRESKAKTYVCVQCGVAFRNITKRHKYCSPECAVKGKRATSNRCRRRDGTQDRFV